MEKSSYGELSEGTLCPPKNLLGGREELPVVGKKLGSCTDSSIGWSESGIDSSNVDMKTQDF